MSSAGEIIYKGTQPLWGRRPVSRCLDLLTPAFSPTLKMMLTIGAGFAITKAGMFTPPSAKGVSLLVIVRI